MARITRRQAVVGGAAAVTGVAAWASLAPAGKGKSPLSPAGKHSRASAVLDAMEGFRKEIPPDTRGLLAGTGLSVKGLEPYTLPHLEQVAEGLGVGTRTECLFLMTYLKDGDLKLRYIAMRAIDKATNAYPHGQSIECLTDTGSEGHRKMLFRFLEVIEKLPL